jgi:AraC-like DNA-binding protein
MGGFDLVLPEAACTGLFRLEKKEAGERFVAVGPGELNHLVFLLEGQATVSCNQSLYHPFPEGHVALLPAGAVHAFYCHKPSRFVVFSFDRFFSGPGEATYARQLKALQKGMLPLDWTAMEIRPPMDMFLTYLPLYLLRATGQPWLNQVKGAELDCLLRQLYTPKEMASFLLPLGRDEAFRLALMRACRADDTVRMLAGRVGMEDDLPRFAKRIEKEFGLTPRLWMQHLRSGRICFDLSEGGCSLIEAAQRNGFCSPSHFVHYCKQTFGCTAGALQKMLLSYRHSMEQGQEVVMMPLSTGAENVRQSLFRV